MKLELTVKESADISDTLRRGWERAAWLRGMEHAAALLDSLAEQCCGGSGVGGETYRVAAQSVRREAARVAT